MGGLPLFATQTDNYAIHAVPVPSKVTIDGDLKDWDTSGKIEMCYDLEALRDVYSAELSAMYDAENLYVAVHFKDTTPMGNIHDPQFQANKGWAGDCMQLRIKTDRIVHVTAWYYGLKQEPAIGIDYGASMTKPFGGGSVQLRRTEGWKLTEGAEMAFKKDADGKGYVQEMKLPWKLITQDKKFAAGDQFRMGVELFWGEADWPAHRYADNMTEGNSSREFFFTNIPAWGPITLEPKGNLKLQEPAYVTAFRKAQQGDATQGPVDISYKLPKAAHVTLAIDNKDGQRVRNLISSLSRKAGKNVEKWDGLDDEGKSVPPGDYTFKVLYHDGIHVNYVMSFASPGNPGWPTADGRGAFYGDHTAPQSAAAGGDFVALVCPMGEAGKHLIGVDLNGQRLWGLANRVFADGGHASLAMDGKTLWVAHEGKSSIIYRVEAATGKYAPWKMTAKDDKGMETQVLDLSASDLPGLRSAGNPGVNLAAIALHQGDLAVCLKRENLFKVLDSETGAVKASYPIPTPSAVTYAGGGWMVLSEGKLLRLDAEGKTTPFSEETFADGYGLASDAQGNVYLSVRGADQNVKVFSPEGKLVREIGERGGRPANGKYNAKAMRNPGQIAIDSRDQLWVPEETANPKRTSVWESKTGALIKDLAGTTGYASAGAINPYDSTLAYSDNTIYHINLEDGTSQPIYSLARRDVPEDLFPPCVASVSRVVVKGTDTYIYTSNRTGQVQCLLGRNGEWRSAAAWGYVRKKLKDQECKVDYTVPPFVGHEGEFFTWADQNGDGLVQSNELTFAKVQVDAKPAEFMGLYWGQLPDAEGTIPCLVNGVNVLLKFPVKGYTSAGAPIYNLAEPEIVRPNLPVLGKASEGMLLGGENGRVYINQSPLTVIEKDGTVGGLYPSRHVSVHGSHSATAAKPGYLIGPSSILGETGTAGESGGLFYLNGNLGQNFIFTHDGLWVQSLFKDTRGAFETPDRAVRGMPMDGITAGGESFGGNFIRTKDGKVLVTLGGTSADTMELSGLDSIRRLGGKFTYTKPQYIKAQQLAQEKAVEASQPKAYKAVRASAPVAVDGKATDWPELLDDNKPAIEIQETPQKRYARVQVRYDDNNLYVAWRVFASRSQIKNAGQDYRLLFKTGDVVDLMLGADPQKPKGEGNLRLLLSMMGGKPMAVLNQKTVSGATKDERYEFTSPWRSIAFDRVVKAPQVQMGTGPINGGYFVEAAIPWKLLGVTPKAGLKLKADFGALFGDAGGTTTIARQYWSNKSTGLVNDVPGEADLSPTLWGTLELE